MNQTLDLTGLPSGDVEKLKSILDGMRQSSQSTNGVPNLKLRTPEEWIADFTAWAESHPKRDIEFDDSRESIYEGCGE